MIQVISRTVILGEIINLTVTKTEKPTYIEIRTTVQIFV